jgi:K+ transporter
MSETTIKNVRRRRQTGLLHLGIDDRDIRSMMVDAHSSNNLDPSDYFQLASNRVVELGEQMII